MTSEPESDEVTKKVTTSTVASTETMPDSGRYSKNLNSAVETSSPTAVKGFYIEKVSLSGTMTPGVLVAVEQ